MSVLAVLIACVIFVGVACHLRKAPWTEDPE